MWPGIDPFSHGSRIIWRQTPPFMWTRAEHKAENRIWQIKLSPSQYCLTLIGDLWLCWAASWAQSLAMLSPLRSTGLCIHWSELWGDPYTPICVGVTPAVAKSPHIAHLSGLWELNGISYGQTHITKVCQAQTVPLKCCHKRLTSCCQ